MLIAVVNRNPHQDNKIYFVGDSLTLCGVDADIVEKELSDSGHLYKVYNMAKDCDKPLLLLIDLENLIESRPDIVLIDASYFWFSASKYNCVQPMSRFSFASDKIKMADYARGLFSYTELSQIDVNGPGLMAHKRQLLVPGIRLYFADRLRQWNISPESLYLKTEKPIVFKFKGNKYNKIKIANITKPNVTSDFHAVPKYENSNKKSFRYIVKRLNEAGIHVVLINMPINPDFLSAISNDTRKNYRNVMTNLGCPYYDLEGLCSRIEFQDRIHSNLLGQRNISRRMAEIIETEVKYAS